MSGAVPAAAAVGAPPQVPAVAGQASRLAFLDIAKGVSIVLVALYHSGLQPQAPALMQALGLFRLPLFFFVSGLVFKTGHGVAGVAAGKARTLLKPYAIVLLCLLARSLWKGEADPWAVVLGIAWGNGSSIEWIPMWFLPHLWLVSVAAAAVVCTEAWQRSGYWRHAAMLLALLAAAVPLLQPARAFTWQIDGRPLLFHWLPFSADVLPFSLAFFLLGVRLRSHARHFAPSGLGLALALAVFAWIATRSGAELNLNERVLREPALAVPAALCGLYAVLSFAHAMAGIGWARRVWTYLGRSSLFILVFHDHLDNKVQAVLPGLVGPGHTLAVAVVAFAVCLAGPLLIRAVAGRSRVLSWVFAIRPG